MNNILTYDGSFEGFMTLIFECYNRKLEPTEIYTEERYKQVLFNDAEHIYSDTIKAERVWQGLKKKLSKRGKNLPYQIFLSELPDIEIKLFNFIKRVFDSDLNIEFDFGDPLILELKKIEQRVLKESTRMLQFVRFQETADGVYFAPIEPEFDVLPICFRHFEDRFADQKWVIYDLKRDYGLYYNKKQIERISLNEKNFDKSDGTLNSKAIASQERDYQKMWKGYYDHINIKERKNIKQQRGFMPERYWKFLPEKK